MIFKKHADVFEKRRRPFGAKELNVFRGVFSSFFFFLFSLYFIFLFLFLLWGFLQQKPGFLLQKPPFKGENVENIDFSVNNLFIFYCVIVDNF